MAVPNVVIFLPEIGGSELYEGQDPIWPGNYSDIISYPDAKLEKLIRCPLDPHDIVRTILGCPYYQSLIDYLYSLGYDEQPAEGLPPSLFVFPYDWRRDLTHVARDLADSVVQIWAAFQGLCSITLLSHGAGGLISRCMLEGGDFDDVLGDARNAIFQLIMIGSGGTGSPEALNWIVGLEGFLILSADQTRRLAAESQRPVFYQYLPAPGAAFLWSPADRGAQFDLYSDDVSQNLQLNLDHLACAIDFWAKLAFPDSPVVAPRYFGFIGAQTPTLVGYAYDAKSKGAGALTPVEADCSGDGLIPTWSADHPRLLSQYIAGSHWALFDDTGLLATLEDLLPAQSETARSGREKAESAVSLSIRFPIVRNAKRRGGGADLVVVLRKGAEAPTRGALVVERRAFTERESEGDVDGRSEHQLELNPSRPVVLSLEDVSDLSPGLYSVSFRPDASELAARGASFIILEDRAPG
jgi:phospholipase A1